MNNVILIGNLTRDPEYRESGNGLCKFTVAVTDGYGENEQTSYIPIVVFGKQALNCEKYLAKGSKVGVQGRIQTGSYEKDGRKVYTTDIIAFKVEFLGKLINTSKDEQMLIRDENRASQSHSNTEGYTQMAADGLEVPF